MKTKQGEILIFRFLMANIKREINYQSAALGMFYKINEKKCHFCMIALKTCFKKYLLL